MTDDRTFHPDPNTPPARLDPESMSRAELIRAAADGEAPMSRIGSEDRARVEFERSLRAAVDRVSPDAKAPAHLRASIERMFREHAGTEAVTPASGGDTRSRSFWNRSVGLLGVAAVLALCAAVVVTSLQSGPAPFGGHQGAIRTASFIQSESDDCSELNDHFNAKFRARSREEAQRLAQSIFEKVPDALLRTDDALISMGYEFAGFGRCAVPGPGRSGHLIYHLDSNPAEALSLFIQEDVVPIGIDQSCCYRMPLVDTTDNRVLVWREGGFVYYLYSHNPQAIETARSIFHAPKHEAVIR